ncbi:MULTISPECIES: acyltransferase [Nostocales]|uniref:Transferase n=3 Tax=Nostocales TaxID=1161 RepID=A0A0C1QZ82_9CYAN|nr:acyltransferase [Tolypothrix bouteillei]KAF3886815.1 acyltransferase [Tolypothrix bouteillei VB521301]
MNYRSSLLIWNRLLQAVLTNLLSNIPTNAIGGNLRNLLYRSIFARMGNSVNIDAGVTFVNTAAIELGNNVQILQGARINASGHPKNKFILKDRACLQNGVDVRAMNDTSIYIDEGTYIGPYVCLAGPGDIKIGKSCLIAAHTGIFANNHVFNDPTQNIAEQGVTRRGIVIGNNCWLGHAVTVLDGVTIGEGSVIGAGAVVAKDIPPYSVAIGVPARVVKSRKEAQLMKSS